MAVPGNSHAAQPPGVSGDLAIEGEMVETHSPIVSAVSSKTTGESVECVHSIPTVSQIKFEELGGIDGAIFREKLKISQNQHLNYSVEASPTVTRSHYISNRSAGTKGVWCNRSQGVSL